ncbi:MAG: hypothetical protein M1839_008705 [Geoglossum umbratile]|nr:MAG: hypothetical protein M1839_008705 [Geoglossum umbratile]
MSTSSLLVVFRMAEDVVQFVSFGRKLCYRISEYSATAGAPRNLAAQADCLSNLLEILNNLSEAEQAALERGLISSCAERARELSEFLNTLMDRNSDVKSKWRYVGKAWRSLHSEKKIEGLQKSLESLLGPLSLHLQVKTAQQTLTIKRQTEKILLQQAISSRGVDRNCSPGLFIAKTVFVIPIARNPGFTGREGLLERLDKELSPKLCGQSKAALNGLGGVGKTQIALEYAYRTLEWSPKRSVFWILATNSARFEESYRRIASEYEIPGHEDPKRDLMQLVRNWLESRCQSSWLMIVDNVDDKTFFTVKNLFGKSLSEYIPQYQEGALLYTTRDRSISANLVPPRSIISVPRMDPSEARELIGEKCMYKSTQEEQNELLEELDYLPLAISQAAAFMNEVGLTISQYLVHHRQSYSARIRLLSYKFADHGRGERPMESVAATWMASFNYIREQNPKAADLLALMSFFDRRGIPKSLLVNKEEDPLEFSKAVGMLDAFSLITTNDRRDNYEMHRLVQLATRAWLSEHGSRGKIAFLALEAVVSCFPNGEYEHWATCAIYLPHAEAVLGSGCEDYSNANFNARAALTLNMSCYFRSRGEFEKAEAKARMSWRLRKEALGDGHLDTLASIGNLALVLHDQGNYKAAEVMNLRALQGRRNALGEDDPDTLISFSNLASVLQDQGRYKEAEDMNREALKGHEKILGYRHPDTLATLGNLALVLQQQGKFEEAEEMHRRALKGCEEVLGTEHPDTLVSLHNFGEVLRDQARYKEAEEILRRALGKGEELLGEEHPFALTVLHNLAEVLRFQGKFDEAEKKHRRALEGSGKVLGSLHPFTLTSLHNLAELLRSKGNYFEAEEMHRQAWERREQVLGKAHLDTLMSANCLALALRGQRKFKEAEKINRALKAYEEALGKDHPKMPTSLNSLALVLQDLRGHEEAEDIGLGALRGYGKGSVRYSNRSLAFQDQGALIK